MNTIARHSSRAALVLFLSGCSGAPPGPTSSTGAPAAQTAPSAAASAPSATASPLWRKTMTKSAPAGKGCFKATSPGMTWTAVPCVTPPNIPYIPATGGGRQSSLGPSVVGNGFDDSSQASSGLIAWAEGSFPVVTGVTTTDTNYSLQLNSNTFSGASLCSGAQNPGSCLGWEQFVYASGTAFIQYWLINYGNNCPSGWNSFSGSCFVNSPGGVSVPAISPANLSTLALIAAAGSGGDSISMSVDDTLYTYGTDTSVVNLNANWTTAEFNIFGNGGGSQYNFNGGSSVIVQTLTDSDPPTTNAPTCSSAGFTGETNNLSLVSGSCCPIGGGVPGIQFMESNASSPSAQSCPLIAQNPNYSVVGHPFDSILAGTDVDGTPLVSCRAPWGGGLHPGKVHPDWTSCDISFGGQELFVFPFETLVAGWTDESNGGVPDDAFAFGNDGAGGPTLYSCRGYLDGAGLQVGKVRPGLGACAIPYGGQEVFVGEYQVLTSTLPLATQAIDSASPPSNALVGGFDADGAPLYVCQASFGGGLVPGKTRSNWNGCDVSFGGSENFVNSYNVLVPDFQAPNNIFVGGNESDGTPLGVCQASYQNSTQVGKYLTSGACNFGFGGAEISLTSGFEVLSF